MSNLNHSPYTPSPERLTQLDPTSPPPPLGAVGEAGAERHEAGPEPPAWDGIRDQKILWVWGPGYQSEAKGKPEEAGIVPQAFPDIPSIPWLEDGPSCSSHLRDQCCTGGSLKYLLPARTAL